MFSVIMPVLNRAYIVGRAIESVLGQTYSDYELLVVDDGSDDAIEEAVKPYLQDKRVRFIRGGRQGLSLTRNRGLQEARGEYIAYLDSDNVWYKDFLARMHEALSSYKCDAAYSMARRLKRDDAGVGIVEDGTMGREFCFKELLEANYIDINTFVHTRRVLAHVGSFDPKNKRLDDWDLIIRVTAYFEVKFVPEVLVDYYYCVEANAVSMTENFERENSRIKARYPQLTEPITYLHDTITYTWDSIPDRKYRNYWLKLRGNQINRIDYKPYGFPVVMQIEPTNMCNLQCPLCPVSQKTLRRPGRHMRLEEFKKVIDNIQEHILLLVMWDWGEPLMNPELPAMLRYAADRDIRTVTSTNAHFLQDEKYVEELLTSGLSTLIVAIDSVDAGNYEKYRKSGSLDKALAGLKAVVESKRRLKSNTTINFRTVVMRQNELELSRLRKLARKMGADIFSIKTVNPACGEVGLDSELVPDDVKYRRLRYRPETWERVPVQADCQRVWVMSNIFSDGSVVPCCYDFDATMKIGNAFEEPFTKIWMSDAYAARREKILNAREGLLHCTQCMINYEHAPQGMFYDSEDLRLRHSFLKNMAGRAAEGLKRAVRRLR
jgi:MoaA/NifB/PqqE/SkfB family radical SAM enzyme